MFKKINILFLLLTLLLAQFANAQFRYGIIGGTNISNHTGSDFSSENSFIFGWSLGFFFEHEINGIISIVTEPSFNQKGANYTDYPRFDTEVFVDNKLNYIDLPLLLKANFNKRSNYNRKETFGQQMNYYLIVGTSLSYLIQYQNEVQAYQNDFEINSDPFFPYTFSKIDASVSIGGGVMWKEIFIDIRYHHGLRAIYDSDNVPDIRNHMLSIRLAFSLYRKRNVPCRKR